MFLAIKAVMKNTVVLMMLVLMAGWARAEGLRNENPGEFEFVHCFSADAKSKDIILHYVIDRRNEDRQKLYTARAAKNAKAKNIKSLNLADDNLLVNTIDTVDVSWVSVAKDLKIEVNILDNGGYRMTGTLTDKTVAAPIICQDVTVE